MISYPCLISRQHKLHASLILLLCYAIVYHLPYEYFECLFMMLVLILYNICKMK
jgi:hypothetical protein